MSLLLDNDAVRRLLPVADCIPIVERAYADLDAGAAVGPPRANVAVPAGRGREYVLKSWQCADPGGGVAAVRVASEVVDLYRQGGRVIGRPVAAGPSPGYTGLVLLFDLTTGELVALAHDSALSGLATAAAIGLAARHLARPDATVLALLGAGRQARLQLGAISAVRALQEVRVYYPNLEQRERFSREIADATGLAVRPVPSAVEAAAGAGLVAAASSSPSPVFEATSIEPGTHVSTTRPSEAPGDLYERADVLVTAGTEEPLTYSTAGAGVLWRQRPRFQPADRDRVLTLAAVVSGRVRGRTAVEQVTVFGALAGFSPGVLYAALGAELVARARRAGAGERIPSESLMQAEPS